MGLIDFEILQQPFAAIVGVVVRAGRAVPVPTVPPLGEDRLIREVTWTGEPALAGGFEGYTVPAGSVLLRFPCSLSHVSVDELRVDPDATGASNDAEAWLLVSGSPTEAIVSLVAIAISGQTPRRTPVPIRLGALPLPTFAGVNPVRAALVTNGTVVVLRIATSRTDDPFGPPANRLPARLADGGSFNWLLHVPPGVLLDLIRSRLVEQAAAASGDARIEEGPNVVWAQLMPGKWGVRGESVIEVEDACPGLFGGVDLSVDVSALAFFGESSTGALDVTLTITTDASDWDSFRCWLGTGAVGSVPLGLVAPFLQMPTALASLIVVSELVRSKVGDRTARTQAPGFTEVGHTDRSKTFSMTIPPIPIPFSTAGQVSVGAQGIDFIGQIMPLPGTHLTSFTPNHGPLKGTWRSEVNCSRRSIDHSFAFRPIIVSDTLQTGSAVTGVPVTVFPTSLAEPAGKVAVDLPNSAVDTVVDIDGGGLSPGDTGFAVVHTSAGLCAYHLGPVPSIRRIDDDHRRFIDRYCDTFHVLRPVIEVQEIRWVEPPPDYDAEGPPLRQWQLVFQGLPSTADLELIAVAPERRIVATARNLKHFGDRAAIEVTTDARSDLVLHIARPPADASFAVATRWLIPIQRVPAPRATALAKTGDRLMVRLADEWTSFDPVRVELNHDVGAAAPDERGVREAGASLTLSRRRVAVVHDGSVFIAAPLNTLRPAR